MGKAEFSSSGRQERARNERPAAMLGGRYRIESRLGKGGAGSVYRAFDTSTDKWIALKRLAASTSKRMGALFEQEYYTLSSVRHPNIVEVYDYGADQEGPYYTMELLGGTDLSDLAPLPWQEACKYVTEIASALGVLHARRLIHRDVSPRNLRRTPEGLIKLIDFGALTAFGVAGGVVGTPPFVAPEALNGQVLDQRVDIYTLGALLYHLVTGSHAYPARSLRALPALWAEPWVNPSRRVAALARADLPQLPSELDVVIESLMSQNVTARPRSTADVIDRLGAVAGFTREQDSEPAQVPLPRAVFVGRKRERRHYRRLLQQALAKRGSTFLIESKPGEGRSRLLEEFALDARIAGAMAVREEVRVGSEARGLAQNVALRLLDALPEHARQAAAPYAAILANLSPEVARRLDRTPQELPRIPGEARALLQEALCGWVIGLSKQTPLVLIVDDLDQADEASQAWLASLGTQAHEAALLVVASLAADPKREPSAALRLLRQAGKRVTLRAFGPEETHELVRSMFSTVEHLARLSDRVQRVALGNPAHIVEQLEHFLRNGLIAHVEGAWVLPQEIADEQLLHTRADAIEARLARLSPEVRSIARRLSLRRGLIPLELCVAVVDVEHRALFAAIEQLVREGVLVGAERGYRFADEACRALLMEELSAADKAAAHTRLGRFLLSLPKLDVVEELEACVHLLQAGDDADAERRVANIARRLALLEPDNTAPSIPALEQALALYRARGRDDYETLPLLVVLAEAGYYVDRRYLTRYGAEAIGALSRTLRQPLARRLRPLLGKRISFFVALMVAAVSFALRRKNPRVPNLRDTIVSFFACVATETGVHTVCIDPDNAAKTAQLLEPWTALGKKHTATFMYEFALNLAATVRDRLGEAHARWERMITTLDDPKQVAWLPEELRIRYLGGALYAFGVLECWRDGDGALRMAERLDQTGMKLYEMSADQVRTAYYANQGNLELYEKHRERAELHAIRRGSAWQVETWAPMAALTPFMRVYDAMGLKQSLEQVQRLSKTIPSMVLGAARARGAYQLLRKRYKEALPWLEEALAEAPLGVVGWARSQGALARCYNALGEHGKARDLCARALSQLTPADLEFPAMTLSVEVEHALAQAGLGELARAAEQIDRLLEKHAPRKGPLTLGALYEARARIAMLAGDEETCRKYYTEMDKRYRGSAIPSLVARCETFGRELRRHFHHGSRAPGPGGVEFGTTSDITGHSIEMGITQLEQALSDVAVPPHERYERALALLAEHANLPIGGLWLFQDGQGELVAASGDMPNELTEWVCERLIAAHGDDVTQTDFAGYAGVEDPNLFVLGVQRFRLFELLAVSDGVDLVVGAVVFAERLTQRCFISGDLLRAMAAKLRAPTTARLSLET
jgi:serine/threonine protein kinase/tetratricopeptide (TPR) repeat protein